jgi:hypothetical protein
MNIDYTLMKLKHISSFASQRSFKSHSLAITTTLHVTSQIIVIIIVSQFVEASIEHLNNAMTKMIKDILIETREISIIRQIQYNQMLNKINIFGYCFLCYKGV